MTETPPPTPVAQAHKGRAKVETLIAIFGGITGLIAALSGLDPKVQLILGGVIGTLLLGAGWSYLRHRSAKKRGE